MKFAAYAFLTGSLTASTAALAPPSSLLNGGALAILGFAVWYTLAKALPAALQVHQDEMKAVRNEHRTTLERFASSLDRMADAIQDKRR